MDVLDSAVTASVVVVVVAAAAAAAHGERGPVDGPPRGGGPALHLLIGESTCVRMCIHVSHEAQPAYHTHLSHRSYRTHAPPSTHTPHTHPTHTHVPGWSRAGSWGCSGSGGGRCSAARAWPGGSRPRAGPPAAAGPGAAASYPPPGSGRSAVGVGLGQWSRIHDAAVGAL